MKFLVNLCLSPKTLITLHSLGYEAVRVNQLNMSKSTDAEIFEYAAKNQMVVLTADLDFSQVLAYTKYDKPSVVIFRLETPSFERVNNFLTKIIPEFSKELEKGSIIIIEEGKVRVRNLPIDSELL
ncbi:MAG: DUF5615 family PIN-like protein [Elusimicrobiota bacterium]